MNRPIKFRCYDKIENKMWTPIIDRDGIPCSQHPVSMQLVRMDGDLLDPIMQFIGLHDSEENDFYIGDIVEFDNGDRFVLKMEDWLEPYVEWMGSVECEDQARDLYRISRAKIIGNIYENPELIALGEDNYG